MKELSAISALAVTALLTPAPSFAAPPVAPHMTVGAGLKQLNFDWDDVPGASYYRLMYQVNSGPFQPILGEIPATTTRAKLNVAVHQHSWTMLRYAVAACNSSGCTNSNPVFPQNLMLDTIGYFKASNTDVGVSEEYFGRTAVLSDDGRTLAIAAPNERSIAAGINGDQNDNSSNSGAVYVFRRLGDGWQQQAYLKAAVNIPTQAFGGSISISADGSVLAVGAPGQDDFNWPITYDLGAVYVFQRSASQVWSLMATLRAPSPLQGDEFGTSVDLSLDARTLKVISKGPFGVDPVRGGISEGRTHIFVRPGATWQHQVTLAPYFPHHECLLVKMSGDGNTLVSVCVEQSTRVARIETRKRIGDAWVHVADQPLDGQGSQIAFELNFDATTMALQELPEQVVGLYQWNGAGWQRERGFAPPLPSEIYGLAYGRALALSRNGNMLAIGDPFSVASGAGVSPTAVAGDAPRGAVYLWKRSDASRAWTLRSVVKSPNPDTRDYFGESLSMCGSGAALAVGADGEDSKARGVDGDRTDNSAVDSGAVYLY